MGWVTSDFECKDCGHEFEEFYYRQHQDDWADVECPACGGKDLTRLISAPNIAKFSIASPEQKASILKKRSEAHTAKEVAKTPEKWGQAGIDRQRQYRADRPQVGSSGKKSK